MPERKSKNIYSSFLKQKNLNGVLNKIGKVVDPAIKKILCSNVNKETKKIINYQVEIGGKRLRPSLGILVCLACKGRIKDIVYPAAGLEILHENSLIIDDIIDHSLKRRGKPTCWKKFGRSVAECLSLDYSAAIFESVKHSEKPLLISAIFSKTIKVLIDGEILDILFEQSGRENERYITKHRYKKIDKKDYFRMIKGKTAALAMACCEIGAISASAAPKKIEALKKYGENLGIGFQIADDILDVFADERKFGKKIGKDIEERKLGNIVIYLALQELSLETKRELLSILRKKQIRDKDIKKAISIIKKTKAREKAIGLAETYIKKAKKNLKVLPQNKWTKILEELADFVITRDK